MINRDRLERVIGLLDGLQDSPKANQEEQDAMCRAKDALLRMLKIKTKTKKHSPGPWPVQSVSGGCLQVTIGEQPIAFISHADAYLIAAAPDLLAALRRSLALILSIEKETGASWDGHTAGAYAAIAKAGGK